MFMSADQKNTGWSECGPLLSRTLSLEEIEMEMGAGRSIWQVDT